MGSIKCLFTINWYQKSFYQPRFKGPVQCFSQQVAIYEQVFSSKPGKNLGRFVLSFSRNTQKPLNSDPFRKHGAFARTVLQSLPNKNKKICGCYSMLRSCPFAVKRFCDV